MPGAHRTVRTHWTNTTLTLTLAVASTVVGVHLAVAAPVISPVSPPGALVANTAGGEGVTSDAVRLLTVDESRGPTNVGLTNGHG